MPTFFGKKVHNCFIILQNYKHDHNEVSLYYSFMWSTIVKVALWAKFTHSTNMSIMRSHCRIHHHERLHELKLQKLNFKCGYREKWLCDSSIWSCFMLKIARERLLTWQSDSQKTQKGQGLFQGSQKSFWIFVKTIECKALFLKFRIAILSNLSTIFLKAFERYKLHFCATWTYEGSSKCTIFTLLFLSLLHLYYGYLGLCISISFRIHLQGLGHPWSFGFLSFKSFKFINLGPPLTCQAGSIVSSL